jgi:hypothetical protein
MLHDDHDTDCNVCVWGRIYGMNVKKHFAKSALSLHFLHIHYFQTCEQKAVEQNVYVFQTFSLMLSL